MKQTLLKDEVKKKWNKHNGQELTMNHRPRLLIASLLMEGYTVQTQRFYCLHFLLGSIHEGPRIEPWGTPKARCGLFVSDKYLKMSSEPAIEIWLELWAMTVKCWQLFFRVAEKVSIMLKKVQKLNVLLKKVQKFKRVQIEPSAATSSLQDVTFVS